MQQPADTGIPAPYRQKSDIECVVPQNGHGAFIILLYGQLHKSGTI